MHPECKQTPAQKELRRLCGGAVPDSVARKVLKILNQVVEDPQRIKIESSCVPSTEDIRQRRLELDKLLQTPPVDEEIARQKAMELAVGVRSPSAPQHLRETGEDAGTERRASAAECPENHLWQ